MTPCCEHPARSHTYRRSTRRNDGPCLSPGCRPRTQSDADVAPRLAATYEKGA